MLRVHTDVFMKVYWYSINSVTTMVVTLLQSESTGQRVKTQDILSCLFRRLPVNIGYQNKEYKGGTTRVLRSREPVQENGKDNQLRVVEPPAIPRSAHSPVSEGNETEGYLG